MEAVDTILPLSMTGVSGTATDKRKRMNSCVCAFKTVFILT